MTKNSKRTREEMILEVLGALLAAIDLITEDNKDTKALDVIITELIHLKHKRNGVIYDKR